MVTWAQETVAVQESLTEIQDQLEQVNKYERQLDEKKRLLEESRDQMHKELSSSLNAIKEHVPYDESKNSEAALKVTGCGSEECNGTYRARMEEEGNVYEYDTGTGKCFILQQQCDDEGQFWELFMRSFMEFEVGYEVRYYWCDVDIKTELPPGNPDDWSLADDDDDAPKQPPGPTIVLYDAEAEAKAQLCSIPDSVGKESEGVMGLRRKLLWEKENTLLETIELMKNNLDQACHAHTIHQVNFETGSTEFESLESEKFKIEIKTQEARRQCSKLKADNKITRSFYTSSTKNRTSPNKGAQSRDKFDMGLGLEFDVGRYTNISRGNDWLNDSGI